MNTGFRIGPRTGDPLRVRPGACGESGGYGVLVQPLR